nr:DNA polymerase III subunit delta' [Bacillus smithii]
MLLKNWDEWKNIQPQAANMLHNSLKKERIAHAYLFEGEKGTGKKQAALFLAKSLLCEQPRPDYTPCGQCSHCRRIENDNHPDLHLIETETDSLSIKKQQIEALQREFAKTAVESKRKIYIIEHADRMTTSAANSLLKFLEEPHPGTTAILLTEQYHRVLPTIISRCQTITFKPLPVDYLETRLREEQVGANMAALAARLTNNLQDALELSADEWFAQARKIVLKLYEALNKQPLEAMIKLQEEFHQHFKDKQQIERALDLLLLIYRDLLSIQIGKSDHLAYPDQRAHFESRSLQLSIKRLTECMEAIFEAKRKLQANMNSQLLMEQLVLKLQGGFTFV